MSSQLDRRKFSFASGANAAFIDSLYEDYKANPDNVEPSWRTFFEGYEFAASLGAGASTGEGSGDSTEAKVEAFINAYRRLGHLNAHLNPLTEKAELLADMSPAAHGLGPIDPDRKFHPSNLGLKVESASFSEIQLFLENTYCRAIGADYREINNVDVVTWMQDQMESCQNNPVFSKEEQLRILDKLIEAEGMEKFLQDRFLGQKRFSIEGLDSLIPLLDTMATEACIAGVEEVNIGMAHRGRLNILANFMGKQYGQILNEFEGGETYPTNIEGDVKYHKGFANEIETSNGDKLRVFLAPNPSHLEAINPVLEGFSRARQYLLDGGGTSKILPLLMHGDAAVVGQGVVAETLNLAGLEAYKTGGTIHIIANNQIGFTANPDESKSCDYASDVAKVIRAPVIHVNADDPQAVSWAAKLAIRYREKFKKDFVIDLVGYRRHGHNETDEPGFTQPLMYKVIKAHPTVMNVYAERLEQAGVLSKEEFKAKVKKFRQHLQECLNKVRDKTFKDNHQVPSALEKSLGYISVSKDQMEKSVDTTASKDKIVELSKRFLSFPDDFNPHPKIVKLYDSRKEMLSGDGAIDWGLAEIIAYAACADESIDVRLSGQDSGRGTFSHRQVVLKDFETGKPLNMLSLFGGKQGQVDVINSPLSEAACLGFEFGYSVAHRDALVLWEAQFGDFVNGAQILMDQFLVASEAKWKQTCSLVMLLPHGYEGQGPEHSSARPERFLQSCGNLNIQVANVTTPAQFFHLLRRQVKRSFQKPLVVMTPKSLLRHPKVISSFDEFSSQTFKSVIDDDSIKTKSKVERLVLCTGKVYYDLMETRSKEKLEGAPIALVRIEQLYPFPLNDLTKIIESYKNCEEICWVQEEPANMGAWMFMRARLEKIAKGKKTVHYIGRKGSGSTAEGSLKAHKLEQQRIVFDSLKLSCPVSESKKKK